MADVRAEAMAMLAGTLADHAGQAVTYRRGADLVELTGTLTDASSTGEAAQVGTLAGLDLSGVDLVIQAADLILGGQLTTPKPGDEIDAVVAGVTHRFQAVRVLGEDVFRYCDPLRTLIRIHLEHLGVSE